MESILTSIKKLLGMTEEYKHFDADLVMHINSVFSILCQLGVGPDTPFVIEDEDQTWDEFVPNDAAAIACVKSYMALRVRLLFDPPTTSFNLDAVKNTISELEWRMSAMVTSAKSADSDNSTEEVP